MMERIACGRSLVFWPRMLRPIFSDRRERLFTRPSKRYVKPSSLRIQLRTRNIATKGTGPPQICVGHIQGVEIVEFARHLGQEIGSQSAQLVVCMDSSESHSCQCAYPLNLD
jgi:hypothetical protein